MGHYGFQIHISVFSPYPDVPSTEAHPDVTAHLRPVDGDSCHSLPVPLMMLRLLLLQGDLPATRGR